MITQDQFVNLISLITAYQDGNSQFAAKLGECFPDAFEANLVQTDHGIIQGVIDYLSEAVEDEDEWIEWFIYDKRPSMELRAWEKNGDTIKMETSADLYKFLIKNNK